jgi:hypothetical protein
MFKMQVVEVLLGAGASANSCVADVVDPFTRTTVWRQCSALWTSVHCGHVDVTKVLIEAEADVHQVQSRMALAECHV